MERIRQDFPAPRRYFYFPTLLWFAGYVVLPADFSSRALQERVISPEVHLEGSQPSDSRAVAGALNRSLLEAVSSLPGAAAAVPRCKPEA